MENGGCEALLFMLKNRDLSGVEIRNFPKTAALQDQQLQSMDAIEKWFLDVLMQGYFWDESEIWGDYIPTSEIEESLQKSASMTNQKAHSNLTQLGMKLQKLVVGLEKTRVSLGGSGRKYAYKFPPLEDCRREFSKATGVNPDCPRKGPKKTRVKLICLTNLKV